MIKLLLLPLLIVCGCAINGKIVKQCPKDGRLVLIEKSKSSNEYLARVSEEARTLIKCAVEE